MPNAFSYQRQVDVLRRIAERLRRRRVLAAQGEHGGDALRIRLEVAEQPAPVGEQQVVGLLRERGRHVADVGHQQRFHDFAIAAVVDPVDRLPVALEEPDDGGFVRLPPAATNVARSALIGAERLGRREHRVALVPREHLERRAQQRRLVLAGEEIPVPVRGAAGTFVLHVTVAQAVARDDLAQHECRAGRHRVDRQRLALEVGERLDRRLRDDGEKAAVTAHERDQVGIVRDLRLALALLIGDQVVDQRESQVMPSFEQRRDQKPGARRVRDLHRHAVRLEEALPLRSPDRQVPSAVERDHADGLRRRCSAGLRGRKACVRDKERGEDDRRGEPLDHASSSGSVASRDFRRDDSSSTIAGVGGYLKQCRLAERARVNTCRNRDPTSGRDSRPRPSPSGAAPAGTSDR